MVVVVMKALGDDGVSRPMSGPKAVKTIAKQREVQ